MPSGSVFDGFAYDFPFLNETLKELGTVPQSVRFESLEPNSNYTVMLYVFSRHVDGSLLYSEPIAFNFSTCVWLGLSSQLFFGVFFCCCFFPVLCLVLVLLVLGKLPGVFNLPFLVGIFFAVIFTFCLFVCLFLSSAFLRSVWIIWAKLPEALNWPVLVWVGFYFWQALRSITGTDHFKT